MLALAQRAGLDDLVAEHVRISRSCGVNPQVKLPCLVAGMIAEADRIDDMGVVRHGAMPVLCGGIRAPSTLRSFLRSFTWGNVLQLQKVNGHLAPACTVQLSRRHDPSLALPMPATASRSPECSTHTTHEHA
jgi:hypothetical protein